MVAGSSKRAEGARKVLQKFGIDINDARNGLFLPSNLASTNPTGVAVRSVTHTSEYYNAVNQLLRRATTKEEALQALQHIRSKLLSGGFP